MKSSWRWAAALFAPALLVGLLLTGCAKRPSALSAATPAPAAPPTAPSIAAPPTPAGPSGSEQRTGTPRPAPADYAAVPDLPDIHFDFDKYDIRPGDAKILDGHAAWLRAHADYLVLIEGHCDERGTDAYNLALGDRRARSTLNYLVAHGVKPDRITTVSYGKERPLCLEHNEGCWAQNRRAHFLGKRG